MVTMKKDVQMLNVFMNGVSIGTLEKVARGNLIFTYDQNWLETPGARPISLSLPLVSQPFTGDKVYNFFDNLLPDNQQIRARIQAKFKIANNQPFEILGTIGKDCVGAIQILDAAAPPFEQTIEAKPLDEKKIAHILRGYQNYPLGMSDETQDFRISIAGAQEKSAFLYHKNKWNIPLGQTPTNHIFKLPIGYIQHQNMDLSDSCENEWLCSKIIEAFGLSVPKSEVLYFEDVKVLVVERFDRKLASNKKWILRLPQEDMCQALGVSSHLKYEADGGPGISEIMNLLLGSVDPVKDRDDFYCSQVLFWLLAAIDGHAKNFSIFIEPEGKYRLTPFYDIMSAYPLITKNHLPSKKIKMSMSLKGKNNHYHWYNIERRHFLETAKNAKFSVERAEAILDDMLKKVDTVIEQVTANLPANFPIAMAKSIFSGMRLIKTRLAKTTTPAPH